MNEEVEKSKSGNGIDKKSILKMGARALLLATLAIGGGAATATADDGKINPEAKRQLAEKKQTLVREKNELDIQAKKLAEENSALQAGIEQRNEEFSQDRASAIARMRLRVAAVKAEKGIK